MRSGQRSWIVLAVVAAMALAASAAAQAEPADGAGRLIERPYTAVLEGREDGTDWAGEVPFSGETSVFDGRCSVPSDWVYRGRWEGFDSIVGPATGHTEHCAQVVWGVDASGAPVMLAMTFSDPINTMVWPDGSTLSGTRIDMDPGFDAETGEMTFHSVSMFTEGTGRLAGAVVYVVASGRLRDLDANMAGLEPLRLVGYGVIRYDPFASAGD